MLKVIEILLRKISNKQASVSKLSKETHIPASRIYKWLEGKGNPKVEDSIILLDWLNNLELARIANNKEIETGSDFEAKYKKLAVDYVELVRSKLNDPSSGDVLKNIQEIELSLKALILSPGVGSGQDRKLISIYKKGEHKDKHS